MASLPARWRSSGAVARLALGVALAAQLIAGGADTAAARQRGYLLKIYKTDHRMELWHADQLVREFVIALGRSPDGHKEMQGDRRTPVGRYFIAEKHVSNRFHRFLGLNYPNAEDASRGYDNGAISARQWADLFVAEERGDAPSSSTLLGGRIGIHGYGWRPYIPVIDWTDGCIAISNEESEYLYQLLPVGTPVLIEE
jgi:murein L,D-transpeptidase YafK